MKRTPLSRYTPFRPGNPPSRRTRLRRESRKQAKRRRTWAESRRTAFAVCGGACVIRVPGVCTGRATEAHHRTPRRFGDDSAGNCVPACSACHSFLTEHPAWARAHGFTLRGGGSHV